MSVAALGATPSPSPTRAREKYRPGSVPASSGTPAVAAASVGRAGMEGASQAGSGSGGAVPRSTSQRECSEWCACSMQPWFKDHRCRQQGASEDIPGPHQALTAPQEHAGGQHGASAPQRGCVAAGNLAEQVAVEEGGLHQACEQEVLAAMHSADSQLHGQGSCKRRTAPGLQ